MSDDDWLEQGEMVPVHAATKHHLSAATGLTLAQIDRAVRDGAPVARRGASRKEGLRFDLPTFIAWHVERQAARHAAAQSGFVSAKERAAAALATIREFDIQERQRALVAVESVRAWIQKRYVETRDRVLRAATQVIGITSDQREELDAALHDALMEISTGAAQRDGVLPESESEAT